MMFLIDVIGASKSHESLKNASGRRQFRAHKDAEKNRPLYLDRPLFDGFESVLIEKRQDRAPQAIATSEEASRQGLR